VTDFSDYSSSSESAPCLCHLLLLAVPYPGSWILYVIGRAEEQGVERHFAESDGRTNAI
jgi:hypothetical protein